VIGFLCEILASLRKLRLLNIAEMEFSLKQWRQIICALRKNVTLRSVHLGPIHVDGVKALIAKMLPKETSEQSRPLRTFADASTERTMSLKSMLVNAGLTKNVKAILHNSPLLASTESLNVEKCLILNRTCVNPELVFDPYVMVSPDQKLRKMTTEWQRASKCFYQHRFRYV
jgi:hypothetical protein